MSRHTRPAPDPVALHMGRLMREALLVVAPRAGEEPLHEDELFARRCIWRTMAAVPLAISDAETLAVVLRRLVGIGYHASRVAKRAKGRRGGEARARADREKTAERHVRLRAAYTDLRARNGRIGEVKAADLLGVSRKRLRAALGKPR